MNENRKETGVPADKSGVAVRRAWQRPEWRKLDAQDSESSTNFNTDGPANS